MYIATRGFTLLELMIVVAIIGILASVALPAYQNYTARSKVSEVILALSACRTNISETVQSAATLPFGGEWACESQAGVTVSAYVETIQTSDEGAVRAQIRNIGTQVNGQYVMLRPWPDVARPGPIQAGDYVAQWDCGPDPANTKDIAQMMPANCRASAAELGAVSNWANAS